MSYFVTHDWTHDLETYLRDHKLQWEKTAVSEYLHKVLGVDAETADAIADELPSPRDLVNDCCHNAHFDRGDQTVSYRIIIEDAVNGKKDEYPDLALAIDRLVQRRLQRRQGIPWLLMPAGRDLNVFTNQLERNAVLRVQKEAELVGEEMLRFRHGEDLYPYCPECIYSAYTPVTGILGCTVGDDAEVIDFSNRVQSGEADTDVEKCPSFKSKETSQEYSSVEAGLASMIKTLPGAGVPLDQVDWTEVLQESVEQLIKNPEHSEDLDSLIERASDELVKDENISTYTPQEEYDYIEAAPEHAREKTAQLTENELERQIQVAKEILLDDLTQRHLPDLKLSSREIPTSGLDEMQEFMNFLDTVMSQGASESVKRNTVSQAMTTWRSGLLAQRVDEPTVTRILQQYEAEMGG